MVMLPNTGVVAGHDKIVSGGLEDNLENKCFVVQVDDLNSGFQVVGGDLKPGIYVDAVWLTLIFNLFSSFSACQIARER